LSRPAGGSRARSWDVAQPDVEESESAPRNAIRPEFDAEEALETAQLQQNANEPEPVPLQQQISEVLMAFGFPARRRARRAWKGPTIPRLLGREELLEQLVSVGCDIDSIRPAHHDARSESIPAVCTANSVLALEGESRAGEAPLTGDFVQRGARRHSGGSLRCFARARRWPRAPRHFRAPSVPRPCRLWQLL
jgi:hypothetical protein